MKARIVNDKRYEKFFNEWSLLAEHYSLSQVTILCCFVVFLIK